jgi:hypothetical protein
MTRDSFGSDNALARGTRWIIIKISLTIAPTPTPNPAPVKQRLINKDDAKALEVSVPITAAIMKPNRASVNITKINPMIKSAMANPLS